MISLPSSTASRALVLCALASAWGCSGGDAEFQGSGAGGSGSGSGVVVAIGGSGAGQPKPNDSADPCGESAFDACVGRSYEGESIPLDIYVMFDQSGSMLNDVGGMTRLEAVQRATAEFLRSPESNQIGIGIGYFGNQPIGQTTCDAAAYSNADVGVTLDHEHIIESLNQRTPTGETPTAAALQGACRYASDWKSANPGRAVVILLVTDGVPEAPVSCATGTCCPTLSEAERAAAECAGGEAKIATYVLGVGPALGNLGSIARAGGTGSAYLVEDENATSDVLAALNEIRGAAQIPCELQIPPPPTTSALDYTRVNLSLSASGGCDFASVYYVEAESKCSADGGWFYDDRVTPSSVKLCPTSCARASTAGARLRFSVGCKTLLSPIP